MRKRSREINIFSMSALDLFASALGAFILIAVVLFPYFPNTGDSPERVAEVKKELAEVQAELEKEKEEHEATKRALSQCETEKQGCESELKSVKFPHLDIVIALDVSGSMRKEIAGLRNEVDELAYVLLKLAPSVGMGVVAFGDEEWDTPLYSRNIRQLQNTSNIEALKRFTATITPNMGLGRGKNPTDPEAINLALNEALNMSWRGTSEKKIIVIVTDHPAYPDEKGNTLAMARDFADRAAGNGVSTINVGTGGNARSFLRALAKAGRGQYVEGGVSMTASILRSLL